MDSDDKPKVTCICDKASGNATVHQCNNTGEKPCSRTVRDATSSQKQNMQSHGEECSIQEQSTSLHTEAEARQARKSAPCQTDSPEQKHPMSHGVKMASANLSDQTLHLTVRLHAGGEEEEEEEEDEEQDEEIGGLINSDGEVVEWEAGDSPERGSDCTEGPQPSRLQGQSHRDSSSPTLIMEVVSVGEDEDREEGEEKGNVVKTAAVSPLYCGKRLRRKVPVVYLDSSDTDKDVPAITAKRRGRRKVSETPPPSDTDADPGISRRTRRKRNIRTIVEPEELNSKTVRRGAAKRSYRRRKDTKPSAEGEITAGKKRPGRRMVHVPIEIPPELLKKPKEKIEYHCSVCGKEFPHAYKLERHALIHTGEKPYCCSICGRGFNQKGNLKTHYKVHLGRKGSVEFDDEANPITSELSEYLKSLPGESRIRSSLRCLECGKECESQSALQAHHITTHTEGAADSKADEHNASQLLFCRRCGIQFSEKEKLEEHMKTHVKDKPYSCPDCGKKFINESYIQIHQRIHTGEKPFLCSQCGRGFHTASSLKLHEMQHSGERPFACSICSKTFRINSYLTAHYQTHIKDRPFICSVCGKGYSRAEELKVHHRLHTGERPYECGQCGKSFIYRQGLRQHQRTHAGKRIGPTRQLGRPKQQTRLDI
ncbi:zinc finger protein 497-like isoform X2 [Parambassis ranga]|nr:zinc finger protein 497-like isoform X2 [Parambassis ranga]XP_028270874.1 zinc finger protein 497-like isoform X2 [Parambassis ranga]XP_028270883.1 zinc finger protein 497-like isoform X2 [Parambassis ranga]